MENNYEFFSKSSDDIKNKEKVIEAIKLYPYSYMELDDSLKCDNEVVNALLSHMQAKKIKNRLDKTFFENMIKRINRLLAYTAMMTPGIITLDFTIEAIKDYVNKNIYQENTISHIQKVVADYFKITIEDLKSKKRNVNIAKPRHIAMYLCRTETEENFDKIGLEFGGRDHSTVIASCDKIKNELKNDTTLDNLLKELKAKL